MTDRDKKFLARLSLDTVEKIAVAIYHGVPLDVALAVARGANFDGQVAGYDLARTLLPSGTRNVEAV